MKETLLCAFLAAAICLPSQLHAKDNEDRACLIDGSFTVLGRTVKSKDCMQSDPEEPEESFKQSCEKLANTSAILGGAAGKITYMKQCKRPAQGICRGFLKTKRDAYYYGRLGSDLADLPSSCTRGGGRWSSGS
ncbi:hypothetical protein [Luteimonas cucumeris]|uniref:hypothetical protein n=1 Tax=Luteimonas cucumeris TaxID=985012 RepID=UPI0011A01C30|nr:hypothetical protein [Luteimonas cucumeris]